MACNTGSVHALDALRAEFEPQIAVIGTVPAIKPAAAEHQRLAIWATVATTASAYQRRLIADFGGTAEITPIACPGLADAVDAGDEEAIDAAVAAAAAKTPAGCAAIVLGCTEYELVADRISRAVPGAVTLGSAAAVAAQALRRVPAAASRRSGGSARWYSPGAAERPACRIAARRTAIPGRPPAGAACARARCPRLAVARHSARRDNRHPGLARPGQAGPPGTATRPAQPTPIRHRHLGLAIAARANLGRTTAPSVRPRPGSLAVAAAPGSLPRLAAFLPCLPAARPCWSERPAGAASGA